MRECVCVPLAVGTRPSSARQAAEYPEIRGIRAVGQVEVCLIFNHGECTEVFDDEFEFCVDTVRQSALTVSHLYSVHICDTKPNT